MSHWAVETIFLATAHFAAGIVGFLYRIFLSKTLGPEGMGIYQQALSFYGTAITLMTAGIPVAVSKLVAEAYARKLKNKCGEIVSSAFFLTSGFSALGAVFLITLAFFLQRRILLLILPAAVLVGFSSVLRGYFLGIQEIYPIRWAILAESLIRTLFGAIVVKSHVLSGLEGKTLGAVTALAVGELASLSVLLAFFQKSAGLSTGPFLKTKNPTVILTIAIPVSLSQLIGSLSVSVEALLVPRSLEISGLSASDSMAVFGKTAGMVLPLLYFPALFIMSLSSNIIPRIAAALSRDNTEYAFRLSQQALVLTSLFSFAAAGFFISMAKPLSDLLFEGFCLDKLIMGFAAGIPFFYAEHVLMAILRATGNNKIPLINSIISFFITNVLLFLLVKNPSVGIYGYSLALITASSASIYISLRFLEIKFKTGFDTAKVIVKPLVCGTFMGIVLAYAYPPLKNLGIPEFICLGADFLLAATGFLVLAMAMGLKASRG
ncbi:MAG: oligosaccharide flippase family protein [Tepidanaerobacteraceae bacterium]|jgi:stage V sporulation protein B|nr:oligosaccharide flippase family protein [Tepidanaerobacteraceae bacterium]